MQTIENGRTERDYHAKGEIRIGEVGPKLGWLTPVPPLCSSMTSLGLMGLPSYTPSGLMQLVYVSCSITSPAQGSALQGTSFHQTNISHIAAKHPPWFHIIAHTQLHACRYMRLKEPMCKGAGFLEIYASDPKQYLYS